MVQVQVSPKPAERTLLPLGLHMPDSQALDRFFGKLHALKKGQGKRARVSVWGASHVAGEAFTGQLRRRFQGMYGDAGPGFVHLGRPWRSYRHSSVKFGESKGWSSERLWSRYSRRRPAPRDDLFGLAGISVHAKGHALAWLQPRKKRRTLAALDLYYLRQPGGGRLEVLRDHKRLKWFFTVASAKEPAFGRIELPKGTRQVTFKATSGEVRIFGVDLESGDPGVVCDSFGINGGRSDSVLTWHEKLMTTQVQRLGPDLIVMAYGSNSVDQTQLTPRRYKQSFDKYLRRMRRMVPAADCLVVGPADQARYRKEQGGWKVPARLDWIVDTQRKVALRRGCVFWDWRAVMGGPKSVFSQITSEPRLMRPDHLHFSFKGYTVFGDALYESLMAVWAQYLARTRS
jgi:lysophospholipase L1-like esterase